MKKVKLFVALLLLLTFAFPLYAAESLFPYKNHSGSVGKVDRYWLNGYFDTVNGTVKQTVTDATSSQTVASSSIGRIFTNNGATASITLTLPSAAAVIGKEIVFVVEATQSLVLEPAATDHILGTSDAGDYIWADSIGETITLVATRASYWAKKSSVGTWTEQ